MVIYPMDGSIQPLNNLGQVLSLPYLQYLIITMSPLKWHWRHFNDDFFTDSVCLFFYAHRQRDKLEDLLRDLTPERAKIAKCMVFCVSHADCAEEVITIILFPKFLSMIIIIYLLCFVIPSQGRNEVYGIRD